jgi:hypothetical protein
MKKKRLFLGTLVMGLALTVVLAGCEKDPAKALQGTWVMELGQYNISGPASVEWEFLGNDVSMNALLYDGTSEQQGSGQFSVSGDMLTLSFTGFEEHKSFPYTLEGNTLTITGIYDFPLILQKKNSKEK